jgi:hypothetical protein
VGLKSVKKKALYDGDAPICHLYYGDDQVLESTLEGCSARLSAEKPDRLRFEVGDGGSGPIVTSSPSRVSTKRAGCRRRDRAPHSLPGGRLRRAVGREVSPRGDRFY